MKKISITLATLLLLSCQNSPISQVINNHEVAYSCLDEIGGRHKWQQSFDMKKLEPIMLHLKTDNEHGYTEWDLMTNKASHYENIEIYLFSTESGERTCAIWTYSTNETKSEDGCFGGTLNYVAVSSSYYYVIHDSKNNTFSTDHSGSQYSHKEN